MRTNTPPVAKGKAPASPAVPPVATPAATELIEPIERPKGVSFATQPTLPPFIRPPVPPGKLKPCLAPPRPITVAAPPPKAVQWVHNTDEDLPKYKNRPPPAPVPTGNRPRASVRAPPPVSAQAMKAVAAAVGEVVERQAPVGAADAAPAAAPLEPSSEAPKKVSRYRAALMEHRQ